MRIVHGLVTTVEINHKTMHSKIHKMLHDAKHRQEEDLQPMKEEIAVFLADNDLMRLQELLDPTLNLTLPKIDEMSADELRDYCRMRTPHDEEVHQAVTSLARDMQQLDRLVGNLHHA